MMKIFPINKIHIIIVTILLYSSIYFGLHILEKHPISFGGLTIQVIDDDKK